MLEIDPEVIHEVGGMVHEHKLYACLKSKAKIVGTTLWAVDGKFHSPYILNMNVAIMLSIYVY